MHDGQDAPLQIEVNGRNVRLPGDTLADLLAGMDLDNRRGVAVAVDDRVVPRSEWSARVLTGRERVTVIQASAGG